MKIDKENIKKIIEMRDSYSQIRVELDELELEIITISNKRNTLLSKLNYLREREARVINNIEESTGAKITPDYLLEVLKNI